MSWMPAEWNGLPDDPGLSRPELLHELFEAQADAHPDRSAVECAGRRLTYAELEAAANRLARHLRARGIGRGSCVALLLPRSIDVPVALLAILKAGAAYVPLDPDYPADRVGYILSDCAVAAVVTTSALSASHAGYDGLVVRLDADAAAIADESGRRVTRDETGTAPDDLAYVIYTSGSTGRPKGVMIEHRSVCNLVRAEGRLFEVRPEDRVYQGFSIAFDASVEEVWLAFFAGATLVVATREMVHAGAALPGLLTEAGVTVLSCVPTLLAMMEDDLPTVRLLILGGEACPADLVARWSKPGRRMVNTYGPTEATVIATYGDCLPGRPVTIGRPVPNYTVHILDPEMRPVAAGAAGELHIGGIGLSRGYVGREDLTREKFVPDPFRRDGEGASRLYKSGDLTRWTADGEIEFLGRIDGQVKIRGFRVELAEIESVLITCPGVLAAAVALREDIPGIQQLVGYVVARDGARISEDATRKALRDRLPSYMVPALVETLAGLPTLPSGKVDRRALPAPRPRLSSPKSNGEAPRTPIEAKLIAAWERLFAPAPVARRDDFFLDLGGHSLLAARMVSELRKDPQLARLSILDVYNHPTIEGLASTLDDGHKSDGIGSDATARPQETHTFQPVPPRRHFLCGLAQCVGLYFILGFFSLQWLAPYLTYTYLIDHDFPIAEAILGSLSTLLVLYPVMLALSIAIKWTVIGRYKAGEYPLWGAYYLRFWFVSMIQSVIPINYLAGSPLLNIYFRLMGAKVGRNVYLGSDNIGCHDLVSIGDDTSIGTDASLSGHTVEDGLLKIGPIAVGRRCFVGTRAVVREHAALGDGATLDDLSMLPRGVKIPVGERWVGSPARPEPRPKASRRVDTPHRTSRLRRAAFGVLHALGLFIFPVLVVGAIFPGMIVMNELNYHDDYYSYLLVSPLVATSFVVLLCLEIALVKWVLLGRVKAGKYPLHSGFYLRKWFVDQMMELSLDVVGPLYSTIYLAPWYRLLGAKLGKRAEISTASFISPDLLTIGDEGFIADCVSLGAARVERGTMTIAATEIGTRAFIGNSALLPPGTVIGDNCLIGCLSTPPTRVTDAARPGTSWLGSPAMFLPQRQETTGFSEESTFRPSRKLQLQRAAIEFLRVTLPSTVFICLTSVLLSAVLLLHEEVSLLTLLLVFPILYAVAGTAAALFVVAAKWALMGRYRPSEQPLWSTFVWRTELVTSLHENLADLFLTSKLQGTPFLACFFRLLGAKIGKRVYLETTQFTEYDLVDIGDDAALNQDCTIQTHLFEDRVMKMSTIRVGDRCTVGGLALVLYDTEMEDGSSLNDLSLLMKGEVLPRGTHWEGIPARPCGTAVRPARTVPTIKTPKVLGGGRRSDSRIMPAATV